MDEALWDVVIRKAEEQDEQMISAIIEAISYRQALQAALALLHQEQLLRTRAETRLRQVMGVESWHPNAA